MAIQKEGAKRLRAHDTPTGARVSEPQHPRTIRSAAGRRRRRPALRTIPKGLGPPAQGWRATPTLGARSEIESTPTALWLRSGARAGTDGPQPRCGWGCFSDDDPRVARASQPWALRRNPVGILERSATLRVAEDPQICP